MEHITHKTKQMAYNSKTLRGVGGMRTKLEAASIVTNAGEKVIIANGRHENVLLKIFQYEDIGTLFLPKNEKLTSRKRWIGYSKKSKGVVFVDEGACSACRRRGRAFLHPALFRLKAVLRKEILFRFVKVKMMAFLRED